MALRKINDERLIDAVKISCTASTAFDHITVYDPVTEEVTQCKAEGLTTEQRDALFCRGAAEPDEGLTPQM